MHFRYLVPEGGGFVETSSSVAEHAQQLAQAIADPSRNAAARAGFVQRFVRPRGLDRPALDHLVAAVEALAAPASAAATVPSGALASSR
jgi:hypothetical protein